MESQYEQRLPPGLPAALSLTPYFTKGAIDDTICLRISDGIAKLHKAFLVTVLH